MFKSTQDKIYKSNGSTMSFIGNERYDSKYALDYQNKIVVNSIKTEANNNLSITMILTNTEESTYKNHHLQSVELIITTNGRTDYKKYDSLEEIKSEYLYKLDNETNKPENELTQENIFYINNLRFIGSTIYQTINHHKRKDKLFDISL
jgi:hypothetical protein